MADGKKYPWIEIAVIIAVVFFLGTSMYYRNWTGFAVGLISFAPIVLFYLHYSKKLFLAASVILMLGFLSLTGWIEALFLVLIYLVSSILIAEMLRRNRAPEEIVFSGIFPSLISGIGLWIVQSFRIHENPIVYFKEITLQNLKETVHYYERIGMDKEKIDILNASLNDLASWFLYLFPGIYIAGLIFMIFLNYLLVRFILVKMEKKGFSFKPLSSWRATDHLIWGFIFSGVLLLLPLGETKILGGNLLIVFMLLYFFQGLALVAYFFNRRGVKPIWQFFSYFLLLIWPLLGIIVALFGLFDIWIDFRKLRNTKTPA
ncbi:MAG: DUF2232 domain-containing protein [Nitrospirae bacterium]|nr:DUF2232 domain-containing protein [Nitrospirota bacterium]MBI3594450.1 DUF2232 domain-containing protein [Nitrospirota bacterium]